MSSGLKKVPVYVKDDAGIAKAWGLRLYEQRKMAVKQLESVRAVLNRPDFPAKIKGKGWDRAAVIQWGMARVEVHSSGRKFVLNPETLKPETLKAAGKQPSSIIHPPSSPQLPEQETPAEDLFGPAAESYETSLLLWKDKVVNPQNWLMAPIQQWQLKEVKKRWPEMFELSSPALATGENIEGGFRGVANWIRNNYAGRLARIPSHTDISNWTKGEYLPHGCRENFTASDANNSRYKTAQVTGWVEKYLVKHEAGQDLPLTLDYRQAQEKLNYERSREEYLLWQQSTSNKFMETAIVAAFMEGFGTWLGLQVDRLIEDHQGVRRLVAAAARNVFAATPEQLALLDSQLAPELAAANDALKIEAGAHQEDLLRQLVDARKESVQKALAKNT